MNENTTPEPKKRRRPGWLWRFTLALGVLLGSAAIVCFIAALQPEPKPPVTVTVLLTRVVTREVMVYAPTPTPADTATPRTIEVRIDQTVQIPVTREVTRVVVVTATRPVMAPDTGRPTRSRSP